MGQIRYALCRAPIKEFLTKHSRSPVLSLQQRPVITKASTSGVLNGLQELIAQRVAGDKDPRGTEKVVKMAAYGEKV